MVQHGNKLGNFHGYYEFRLNENEQDKRLSVFKKEWFVGKKCWDIGCNNGTFTIEIGKTFEPAYLLGTDVDGVLINQAIDRLKSTVAKIHQEDATLPEGFTAVPWCFQSKQENLLPFNIGNTAIGLSFPFNVHFQCENCIIHNHLGNMYDTITCLSVTKWIHLYHGDAGLKQFFAMVYEKLMPNGIFILEPQPWKSYHHRKNTTPTTKQHFDTIQLRPKDFPEYLSNTIGFQSVELLQVCHTANKGFKRPIYICQK